MEKQEYSEAGKAIRDVMQVSPIQAWGGGLAGAVLGAVAGWFAFSWLTSQGLYALALPGALVGLGFGFLSRRPMVAGGVFCAIFGLLLMLVCEWSEFPFIADGSIGYFFGHLTELKGSTWLFIGLGTIMAFWFGRGR